jgi:hypothetical protein
MTDLAYVHVEQGCGMPDPRSGASIGLGQGPCGAPVCRTRPRDGKLAPVIRTSTIGDEHEC